MNNEVCYANTFQLNIRIINTSIAFHAFFLSLRSAKNSFEAAVFGAKQNKNNKGNNFGISRKGDIHSQMVRGIYEFKSAFQDMPIISHMHFIHGWPKKKYVVICLMQLSPVWHHSNVLGLQLPEFLNSLLTCTTSFVIHSIGTYGNIFLSVMENVGRKNHKHVFLFLDICQFRKPSKVYTVFASNPRVQECSPGIKRQQK